MVKNKGDRCTGPIPRLSQWLNVRHDSTLYEGWGGIRLSSVVYYHVSLPEAVKGAGSKIVCHTWRRLEPHDHGVLLVNGAIARLLVLVLPHRVAVARVFGRRALAYITILGTLMVLFQL